ncbi:MAG: cation diffusion facilitator family transporter [Dehalococcoidia bacterium]|nr:cation diffusion facilitator family transporter [Dehalococcoidia bacterium]
MSGHSHHHGGLQVGSKLKIGIILTGCILLVELVGGFLSNSLALLGDAGHVFADVVALSLSWYGVRQAERPSSGRMTFGYHRVGVIIAIVNAVSIFAIAAVVFYEAYRRLQEPPEINGTLMLSVAIIGLGINVFVAYWLRREQRSNLNVRSAYWHALGDALASLGVIAGGIIILVTGWYLADPIISLLIGFIIILAAWRILREGLVVLLEATPPHVDTAEMIETLSRMPGVKDVHDVHVWSISPELHAMSGHVLIDDLSTSEAAGIRGRIEEILRHRFDISHTTLQMECEQCDANDVYCTLKSVSLDESGENPPSEH